jgi:hypothetical protein
MMNSAKLLWSCKLDGSISMGTPDYVPPGVPSTPYYFRSDWSGSDSAGNGKTQLQTALGSNVLWQNYYILVNPDDVVTTTTADLTAVFDFSIATNDLIGGTGNKIVMTQKKRSSTKWDSSTSRPQAGMFTTLIQANQVYDLYVRKIFKVPSNMAAVLAGAPSIGWCEYDAIKCSHNLGSTVDLRYSFQISKLSGESGLRFMAQIDRGTGGTPLTGYPLYSAEGSCVPGNTYLMEYYIRRPRTGFASNTTDGLFQNVLTDLNTNTRYVVANVSGGVHFGVNSGQMSLFYHYLQYTGGFDTGNNFVLEMSNLEYWNKPPNGLIIPNKPNIDALS